MDRLDQLCARGLDRSARQAAAATADGGPSTDFLAGLVNNSGVVKHIPLDLIDPWRDDEHETQPFHLYPADKLAELAESIKTGGVLVPVQLRVSPYDKTRYQTLAGHNRIAAAKLAGLTQINAIIENVDDVAARDILLDTNLYQREKILPSEKAFAYKMKMDNLSHQGKAFNDTSRQVVGKLNQSKDTSRQPVGKLETANFISDTESGRQVQRYIRLTYLLAPLLELVDSDAIPFLAGVSLSYLSPTAQRLLLRVMADEGITAINRSQAEELKAMQNELDEEMVLRIFGRSKKYAVIKQQSLRFPVNFDAATVQRYKKDAKLQALISATIERYIAEQEGTKGGSR